LTARPASPALPEAVATLCGCRVARLVIDDSLTLVLQGKGREATLRIDGAGHFTRGGASHRFSADEDPAGLAPLLSLLGARVQAILLADDGGLEVRFENDAGLRALPDEHQVSWTVRASDGRSAACLAEGKVVWQ
jgi:hypothetical protein